VNRRALVLGVALAATVAGCGEKYSILSDPHAIDAYGFQLLGPASNLPRGTVRFQFKRTPADAASDSLAVSLAGLDSLGGGFYTAWIGDSLGTSWKRATGALSVVRVDTTFDADGNPVGTPTAPMQLGAVSSFKNGGPNQTFTWAFSRTASGLTAADSMQTFLVSIEQDNAATTPGSRRAIWAKRGEGTNVPATGTAFRNSTIRFGNWGPTPTTQYLFVGTARGRAITQGRVLMASDSSLSRPPIGYFYSVWLVKRLVGQTSGGDTLFAGFQTSPWPRRHLSQFNADSIITDPVVVIDFPRQILAGSVRLDADTLPSILNPANTEDAAGNTIPACVAYGCPYLGYNELWVSLKPKDGVSSLMGVSRVMFASIPPVITNGARP
jgi:hypothetical protein